MRLLKTRYQRVDHVEFGGGGLLACGTKLAVFWPTPTGDGQHSTVCPDGARCATFVAGGEFIAYCDGAYTHLLRVADGVRQPVETQRVYANGVASLGATSFVVSGYQHLRAFELTKGSVRSSWSVPPPGIGSRPLPLNAEEFVQFRGGSIHIGVSATGREVRTVPIGSYISSFTTTAVSPDSRLLTCTVDNRLWLFDLTTAQHPRLRLIENTDGRHFTGVAFHPSGRYLAATSNDATVKLYDTSNWALATTFTWDIGRMRSVAFSPDGLLAAAGSDTGKVVVWDVDV